MPAQHPLNRSLPEGIRRVGFRKWYERELLASHAHMALALLAAVAMVASFEAYAGASPGEKLLNTAFVLVCAGITLWALRRYLYLLMHAEAMANQASCPRCKAYGQLVLREPATAEEDRETPRLVPVCCKRCGFTWSLDDR